MLDFPTYATILLTLIPMDAAADVQGVWDAIVEGEPAVEEVIRIGGSCFGALLVVAFLWKLFGTNGNLKDKRAYLLFVAGVLVTVFAWFTRDILGVTANLIYGIANGVKSWFDTVS